MTHRRCRASAALAAGFCVSLVASAVRSGVPDAAGGIGGSPLAGTLAVRVIDAVTLEPLASAFVLVGPAEGVPFAGNVALTNGSGEVVFSDPSLAGSVTVTAGAPGRAYVSFLDVPSAEAVLPLPPIEPLPTVDLGDAFGSIEVANGLLCSGDGNLDIGLVFSSVPVNAVLGGSGLFDLFFSPVTEPLSLPLGQQAPVPSNLVAPVQCELFGTYQKTTWHLGVPAGNRSLYGLTFRGPLSAFLDLAGGAELGFDALIALLQQVTFREFDILRNLDVELPSNAADLAATTPLVTNLTVQVQNALPARSVLAAAGGRITSDEGVEEMIITGLDAFDTDTTGSSGTLTPTTVAASGEVPDLVHGLLVAQLEDDDGTNRPGATTIMRRSGFTPPATLACSDFYDVVRPETTGATSFAWNDVRLPASPALRDLNVSRIVHETELPDPRDPLATITESRTWWILHGAGTHQSLTLPVLPPSAPGALPNPSATMEQDVLAFAHDVFQLGDHPTGFDFAAYALTDVGSFATHVASGSALVACDTVSEIVNLRLARDGFSGAVTLTWDPSPDACHDALSTRGFEVYAGDDAVPAVAPGDWPNDPPMAPITDDDTDGSLADASFTHVPSAGPLFYVVVDRGLTGTVGPAGHYGSFSP
jgi:hypothetical protein